jgi:ABC-type multidrug transport system ATPase subunit
MPNGYDTQIGPGGFELSGGQKQSVALARAFYKKPRFVVLDEPNSNLDDASEQSFRAALDAMRAANAAIVIMTHDPRIARVADLLLVLREGRQIGFGTPEEMLAAVQPGAAIPNGSAKPEARKPEEAAKPAPHPIAEAAIPAKLGAQEDAGTQTKPSAEAAGPTGASAPNTAGISVSIEPAVPSIPATRSPDLADSSIERAS